LGLFDDHNEADDATKDFLAELVGEDKKFKSVEDLARGKAESDRFITQLQNELAEARTEVQKRIALEELKTAILERETNGGQPNGQPIEDKPASVDANSIEELVSKKLADLETTKTKTANEAVVTETLNQLWGDNAATELKRVAADVGMSVKELGELGQRNPKALFKLIGVGNQPVPNGGSVPRSSIHVDNSVNGERNKKYYDKLKATDPRSYWDKKTQVAMMKDAMRLKESFYN